MRVETFLVNHVPRPEDCSVITPLDTRCIMALRQPNGFVKMSLTVWRRLEVFIDILKTVDFTAYEEEVDAVIKKHKEGLCECKLQSAAPGSGESKVACADKSKKRRNKKAGSLPNVPGAVSSKETTGTPP